MKLCLIPLLVLCSVGSGLAGEASSPSGKRDGFVHPGLLHSNTDLEFIRQKLQAGEEPWVTAWKDLRSPQSSRSRSRNGRNRRLESRSKPDSNRDRRRRRPVTVSSLDHIPQPRANVVRGPSNNPNIGSSDFSTDSTAAYSHALQWCLTGETAHAKKSIEIINAWSGTLETVSGHDARLLVGMAGMGFCNAAELLKYSHAAWREQDQEQFEHMLREVFYPVIKDFYPSANGNWDASMIQTMLAMGVYLDDHAMFDRAVTYYLEGEGNGAIDNYINEFGECQESGRDQAHTQMGLGFLANACEIAWKQGVDLYGAADNRLAIGFEYTAKFNLGNEVRYEPYTSFERRYHYPKISNDSRGRFAPIYERVVHHYHERVGLDMPFSRQVTDSQRPEGFSTTYIPWGTLTSYGPPR
ncbi:MAG: alginate lyase family protein [Rhodopirellula sp. JB053]